MSNLPQLRDFDDPAFNPFLSDDLVFGTTLDPYPKLAEMRREASVHCINYRVLMGLMPDVTLPDAPHYLALGYDEVSRALGEPHTFSNAAYTFNLGIAFGKSLSVMEPPEHPRYRRIFQKAFLPQVVAKWGETIVDPVVTDLLDGFINRGAADLVQEFTLHYPFRVIYRQLGLPLDQTATFHKLAIAQTLAAADPGHAVEASDKLGEFFKAMVDGRRRQPADADDLVTRLINSESEGEQLSEEIIISFLRQLVNAAGDTTYRATSSLLVALLRNPDQLEAIRADRSLIAAAIEEGLRWEGPVLIQSRFAAIDTTLGGVAIPRGAHIDVAAGAANRDETRFPDPDKFDIFRVRRHPHLSFARGPHACIGMHLARVEMTRALTAILDRLPNLRLDPDRPAPEIRGAQLRKPEHVFVRFDPA
jgi:cytochrome P450